MDKKMVVRHSESLGEDLAVNVFGTAGQPIMAFAPLGQAPESLEEAGLVDELADYLDAGVVQLFCVSNIDGQSWASSDYAVERAARQEAYYQAICDEIVPLVHELSATDARPLALGFDMGATHAAIFALRRPDLFQGCVCLSGTYDASRYFGDWMDATLYDNTPCAFLPNMPVDHPYIALYNQRQLLFCCGQESSEAESLRTTREIDAQLQRLGVEAWCDYWGGDVSHSWFWWKKQIRYFMPIVLEDIEKTTAAEKATAKRKAPAKKRATTAKKTATKKAAEKNVEAVEAAEAAEPKKAAEAAEAKPAVRTGARKAAAPKTTAKKAAAAKKTTEPAAAEEAPAAEPKTAAKPAAKKPATAKKTTTAKKPAAKVAEPASAAAENTALAKAEKPAAPAKAEKPAAPAKTTKATAAKKTATKTAAKTAATKTTTTKTAAKTATAKAATKPTAAKTTKTATKKGSASAE